MTKKINLKLEKLTQYLETRHDTPVQILEVRQIGGEKTGDKALKQFGYGRPLLVTYQAGDETKEEVFHSIRENAFGRERQDDRVAAIWLDYNTFNHLPHHVPAVDMIMQTKEGDLSSLQAAEELLLITTFRPGQPYANDLARIRDEGVAQPQDVDRVETLAAYLAEIHQIRHESPPLWRRRLRDLVGHGEGIMGLTDSYPADLPYAPSTLLQAIEASANRWRWRLKPRQHRLRQVHGDFHPFNIIFAEGSEFYVLDRSRGAWGEPADDVSCLTINYLFFSLQRTGKLERPFSRLHEYFWQHYLELRPDEELVYVIQPWLAWRALVLASPIWYPTISEENRRKLLAFAGNVMAVDQYDYLDVNQYLEER
jgi:streptomycin 6-kinase